MVLKKKFPIRILAIAAALVVLFSCLPVVPAAAAGTVDPLASGDGLISGFYHFEVEPSFSEDLNINLQFESAGSTWDSIYIDASSSEIWYENDLTEVCVYDPSFGDGAAAWQHIDFRTINIISCSLTVAELNIFNRYLSRGTTSKLFFKTITIADETFSFSEFGSYPSVSVFVSDSGAVFTTGVLTQRYTYSGDGVFRGLSFSDQGPVAFAPGENSLLPAGDLTLYPVDREPEAEPDPVPRIYETIIVLAGSVYTFTSSTDYPLVTCAFLEDDRVSISDGIVTYYWTPVDGLDFVGFSLTPGREPSFKPIDEWWRCQGSDAENIFQYYAYYSNYGSGGSDGSADSDEVFSTIGNFISIMISPVMAFFQAEFIPGFTLGKICLFSFLIGLLFWFLSVSKS